eukprot:GGOE01019662.1.p1 GENE.GGOE01019662.1~~GGOE01019662.1.p1  ORF type:complete len:722 (-),score=61.08 GGOE01019662.1:364-2529(-)
MDSEGKTRLFIGQVPATASEDDIRPIFAPYGEILEVHILRNKESNEHRGCAFVNFRSGADAANALRATHNSRTLPGAARPIQVSYAQNQGGRGTFGSSQPPANENTPVLDPVVGKNIAEAADIRNRYAHRISVNGIPSNWSLEHIQGLFARHGQVVDLCIHLKKDSNEPTGSVTAMMSSAEEVTLVSNGIQAEVANGVFPSTLVPHVVYSNDDLPSNGKLFIGQLPDLFAEQDIRQIFEHFGRLEDINVLRDKEDRSSKGCAFMRFSDPAATIAVICLLHGKFRLQGNLRSIEIRFAQSPAAKAAQAFGMPGMDGSNPYGPGYDVQAAWAAYYQYYMAAYPSYYASLYSAAAGAAAAPPAVDGQQAAQAAAPAAGYSSATPVAGALGVDGSQTAATSSVPGWPAGYSYPMQPTAATAGYDPNAAAAYAGYGAAATATAGYPGYAGYTPPTTAATVPPGYPDPYNAAQVPGYPPGQYGAPGQASPYPPGAAPGFGADAAAQAPTGYDPNANAAYGAPPAGYPGGPLPGDYGVPDWGPGGYGGKGDGGKGFADFGGKGFGDFGGKGYGGKGMDFGKGADFGKGKGFGKGDFGKGGKGDFFGGRGPPMMDPWGEPSWDEWGSWGKGGKGKGMDPMSMGGEWTGFSPDGAGVVAFVPWQWDDNEVRSRFLQFGNIVRVKLPKPGTAFINYDNVPSAERAIAEMEGVKDGTWTLRVRKLVPRAKPY